MGLDTSALMSVSLHTPLHYTHCQLMQDLARVVEVGSSNGGTDKGHLSRRPSTAGTGDGDSAAVTSAPPGTGMNGPLPCDSTGPKEVAISQGPRQWSPHLQGRRRAVGDVDLGMPSRERAESLQMSRYRWVITGEYLLRVCRVISPSRKITVTISDGNIVKPLSLFRDAYVERSGQLYTVGCCAVCSTARDCSHT